jgi:hypothetical protein
MRLGTTIAAVVLVGSLTSSTAEMSMLSTPPASPAPTALGPPLAGPGPAAVEPVATSTGASAASAASSAAASSAAASSAAARPNRTATARTVRGNGAAPSWSVNLSAGEGAGVSMVSGAIRLDPSGVFLAPLEDASGHGAAGTGSTGADAARATEAAPTGRASTEGAPTAGTPVPTGLLTLPVRRLTGATMRVDSVVVGLVPAGSTATVDVRGRDADGNWTEWIPTGGGAGSSVTLPRPSVAVQGRLVLTGPPTELTAPLTGPAVRGVTLTVHPLALPGIGTTTRSSTSPPATTPTSTSVGAARTTPPATSTPATSTPAPSPNPNALGATSTTPTAASTSSSPEMTTTPPTTSVEPTPTTEASESSSSKSSASSKSSTTSKSTTSKSTTTSPSPTTSLKQTAGDPLKYRVFATREGLVGRTTANGHKIKSSDRFVALPSRRALSPRGTNDYSVKVCASNGRCAVAPVWDVGPWNTRDDYWNPSSRRQEWRDLPQGMPEAQAAKERGYNGGSDQFKRKVANPAGIDLSDGLFWGALGLKDNGWVTVEYLWTGSAKD